MMHLLQLMHLWLLTLLLQLMHLRLMTLLLQLMHLWLMRHLRLMTYYLLMLPYCLPCAWLWRKGLVWPLPDPGW